MLTLAVLIPISGWLADRFGARRVFGTAIAIFTLASIGCALAVNLPMLVATRVLQGIGGAMMVPVGRLVVLRTTAKSDLVRAIAYLTWPALLAPVIAPALGGILSTYASWRWIFVINVPLGVAGLLLARRLVPDVRAPEPPPLDGRGFALTAIGVAALVVGLEDIGGAAPNPDRRRDRPGPGRGLARHRGAVPAADPATAARPAHPAGADLPDHRAVRVGVPGRDQCGARSCCRCSSSSASAGRRPRPGWW